MTKESARKISWAISFFVLLLIALLGSLLAYQHAYAGKIYRNVYISNVDLSGLTKKQARALLDKKFQEITKNQIVLKANNKEVIVTLANTGIEFNVNAMIDNSYMVGRDPSFYGQLTKSASTIWQKNTITAVPTINQNDYEAFINLIVPQLNISAQDATLALADGKVVQTNEITGQKVKTDTLTDKLLDAVEYNKTEVDLDVEILQPNVSLTDFSEAKNYAESILNKKITLQFENFAFTPNQQELGEWITFGNENSKTTASLDNNQIKAYLTQIATNFEIQKVNKKVNATDGNVIIEGKAGKYLDKDSAVNAIKSQINNSNEFSLNLVVKTVEPEEEKVFPTEGFVTGRFPGKYIDVDLTQQKLCLINNTNIDKCFIVSTGKWSTPTPVGTRTIDSKEDRRWSSKYGLWMPYWESLGGGYGIHELPEWPSGYKEGEAHLGTPVSHGCIRLGVGAAQEVYNWTEIGTQVYIHK